MADPPPAASVASAGVFGGAEEGFEGAVAVDGGGGAGGQEAGGRGSGGGAPGCPCVDAGPVLASLVRRSCRLPPPDSDGGGDFGAGSFVGEEGGGGGDYGDGELGVLLTIEGPCVPRSYGSGGCRKHPACAGATASGGGPASEDDDRHCDRPWCYVDARRCAAESEERVYRSARFPWDEGVDLFYSYTTCDPSLDDWSRDPPGQTLGGIPIEAITPTYYFPPYAYKRDPDGIVLTDAGDEYYDDSVPVEGVLVDYLERLREISGGGFDVTYRHGSRASHRVHPLSAFTAAAQDVGDGLADLAVSAFWVTGERYQIASFATPLYITKIVLVIPTPRMDESLSWQISKVFAPFTLESWALILAVVVVAALLSVCFGGHSRLERHTRAIIAREQSRRRKVCVYSRLALDSFLEKGTFFCAAGIEQEMGASLPYKVTMFGFGFFILIVVSAYVANLAAFLTQLPKLPISTMDEAVANGKSICALPPLESDLEIAYPSAKFVCNSATYDELLDDFDAGRCDFLAVGKDDALSNIELVNQFCNRNLTFTDSVILENKVSFPVRSELAAGLSYWIHVAEKYHKVTVRTVLEEYNRKYQRQAKCAVDITTSQEVDDYAHITPKNLFFPVVFFVVCAVLAAILQYCKRLDRRGSRMMWLGRLSKLPFTRSRSSLACDTGGDGSEEDEDLRPNRKSPAKRPSALTAESGDEFHENHFGNSDCNAIVSAAPVTNNSDVSGDNLWLQPSAELDDIIDYIQEMKRRKEINLHRRKTCN